MQEMQIWSILHLVHSEGDQPWDFFGRTDAKAKAAVLWPPHAKSCLLGKYSDAGRDWGQEEKGTTEDEMAGWHHWLDGRESEWNLGDVDGQGGLACCDSWGRKKSDTTEQLNWTKLNRRWELSLACMKERLYLFCVIENVTGTKKLVDVTEKMNSPYFKNIFFSWLHLLWRVEIFIFLIDGTLISLLLTRPILVYFYLFPFLNPSK